MIKTILLGAAAALLFTGPARAQDASSDLASGSTFLGLRAEAQIGYNRFQSQGTHDHKLGYGGAVGFDGRIGDRIVIGPEGTFWHGRGENITTDVNGGVIANKSFHEFGVAVRAGYLVTPKILVYAKGGWVEDEQRKSYGGVNGVGAFYDHYYTDGYQLGGGAEYALNRRFYVNAEYKYSNFRDHTLRQRALLGAGVRFP